MSSHSPLTRNDLTPEERERSESDWGLQHPLEPCPGFFADVPDGWLELHNGFNARSAQGGVRVVFIGDSITQGWGGTEGLEQWNAHFADLPSANYGIGGDRTQQLLWRMDHGNLDGIAPEVVVLLIGVNNLWAFSHTYEEVAAGVRAVVGKLQLKVPSAKILLYGIFPTGQSPEDPHRKSIVEINAISSKMHDGDRVHFVDIGNEFVQPDGTISTDTMPDFCHLSAEAYALWAVSIREYLPKLLR